MKTKSTFTNTATVGLNNPWCFDEVWDIDPTINDGYPHLQWASHRLEVTTDYPENIGTLSFQAEGTITDAYPNAFRRGFAYFPGVSGTPTLSDTIVQQEGDFGVGKFILPITGLVPSTAYRVRAYAENDHLFAWGNVITVITLEEPVVETLPSESIAAHMPTWQRLHGYVEYDGGIPIQVRFEYGTSDVAPFGHYTAWRDRKPGVCPPRGWQTGDYFQVDVSGLEVCTTYYFRAQVWSEEWGISSGETLLFSTPCDDLEDQLKVVTHAATDYIGTQFIAHGAIIVADPHAFRRGFVYVEGGVGHPTVADSVEQQGGDFGPGLYSYVITGLNPTLQYRVRAFAESAVGIAYGNTITVPDDEEPSGVPVLVTYSAVDIGSTSFRARGEITSTPTAVTERGFVYLEGSTGTPTLADSVEDELGNWGAVAYNLPITGLTAGTYYRVRAYAINSAGTGYGNTVTVRTTGAVAVVTNPATDVGTTSARIHGRLIDDGGDHCQWRFQWGYATGVYSYALPWTNGLTSGASFHLDLAGLDVDTTYYFRAQAQNAAGLVSGNELSFHTGDELLPPNPFDAWALGGTEINVSWTKGGGAHNTIVQMSMGSYPTTIEEGTRIYFDIGNNIIVGSLTPGMTYYFSGWSESDGTVSANYSTALATTLAGSPDDPVDPTLPDVPWGWFKAPSTARIQNAFFYDQVNNAFDAYHLPHTTGWTMLALLFAALMGVGVLTATHGNVWAALIAASFALIMGTWICVLPLWPLILVLLMGGGYAYIRSRP